MQISLDKLFQKKIQTSEVNLPSEVWIAIETKLRKRRRVRIFWSVFGISFVILIISILVFYPPKKELPINFHKNTNLKELKDEQVKTKKKSNLIKDLKNKKTKKIFSPVSNISVEKRSELSNSQNYNTIKTKDNNKLESNRHKKAYDYNKTEEILKDDSFQKFSIYTLQKDSDLKLITIRHYTEDVVNSFTIGKLVLFQERLKNTVHIVVKELVE